MNDRLPLFQFTSTVSLILLSWFLAGYYGGAPQGFPAAGDLLIPLLWSLLFISLRGTCCIGLAIAVYTLFLLMLLADRLNFGGSSLSSQITYLFLSWSLGSGFLLLQQLFSETRPRITYSFLLLLLAGACVLPVVYIVYALGFDTAVTRETIYAILQSNLDEAIEFCRDQLSSLWFVSALGLCIFLGILLLQQGKGKSLPVGRPVLLLVVMTFTALSYANRGDLRLYRFAGDSIREYKLQLKLFRKVQDKLKFDRIQFSAHKEGRGENYVVVIGESLNRGHMGLYGYPRDTTPRLSELSEKGELLVFGNAFSNHTHTMPVLSLALTEANQSNGKQFYDSLSIINILNKSEIDTYWITNQILYGAWDNLASAIAHQADQLVALNHAIGKRTTTRSHDGKTIPELDRILTEASDNNRVIFVHLMGNHGNYCSRYPPGFSHFSSPLEIAEFGKLAERHDLDNVVNCYDNSVLYNDHVVASLIASLRRVGGVSGLLYFSDHADDVLKNLGHDSNRFTYEMTQIPLIMWFSDAYKRRYPERYGTLSEHRDALYSNGYIYDTLVGIFGMETNRYERQHDLSAEQYRLNEDDARTLHGKILYSAPSNRRYQQQKNIKKLQKSGQSGRVIPHRVNTIGKLREAWRNGLHSFEIDLFFDGEHGGRLMVGHDDKTRSGATFERFLASIPSAEIEKIWVDLKNLSRQNFKQVLSELHRLDARFSLKGRTLIESGTSGTFFSRFREAGWDTSYYLPASIISPLMIEHKAAETAALAAEISRQSRAQKLSAISFDRRLYPFVKNTLEPLLSNDVLYHTWDLSAKFWDIDLDRELDGKAYYRDPRVRTILLPYQSPFHL